MKNQNNAAKPISIFPSRRKFLKKSIVLTGMLSAGGLLFSLAPSTSWALEANHLSSKQAQTLLAMAKRLYPHKNLDDAVYAMLVKDIDQACEDQTLLNIVTRGVKDLNSPITFSELTLADQKAKLQQIENTDFFQKVRAQCITSIYDHPMAQIHFGYEGESWSKGGYLLNGFNDLLWLDNPPNSASPVI